MVINCFTYNGEKEMLKLHLEMMYPFVDKFIIVEGSETFNGTPKPLYFKLDETLSQILKWADKIQYYEVTKEEDYPNDPKILDLADHSPNVPPGQEHWRREFYKKELIQNALKGLQDEDTVIVGDVDEVLDEDIYTNFLLDIVVKPKLRVYAYWLNNRSNEQFYGPIVTKYKNIKNATLNHLRQFEHIKLENFGGWHFTNCGGEDEVIKKVRSSYDEFEYVTYEVLLRERMKTNEDYIGRKFEFKIDESEWPKFLKENREKYIHLLK